MFHISGLADRLLTKLGEGPTLDQRTLIQTALWFAIVNSAMYCLVAAPDVVLHRNMGAIGGFVFLLAMVRWGGLLTPSIHALLVLQFAQLVAMAAHFGGINSPFIASMPLLPITALLLLSMRWALIWLAIIALQNYGQYLAITHGWIDGAVGPETVFFPVVLFIKVSTLIFLVALLQLYDWTYRKKIQKLAVDSDALNIVELNLQQAQNKVKNFVDCINSDIRSPLEVQLKLSSVLIAELSGHGGHSEAAHQIRLDIQKLLQVSRNILDLANSELAQPAFTLSAFYLPDVLESAVAASAPGAPGPGSSLVVHQDASAQIGARGDVARFRKTLTHLLTYARRQIDSGTVEVFMRFAESRAIIEIPLAAQTSKNLPSSPVTGTVSSAQFLTQDLELAVCTNLAAEAGGQFCVYQRGAHTVLLWLEWPLSPQAITSPLPVPAASSSALADNKRFLLVEHVLSNQLEVQTLLKRLWPYCHVGLAENADSALLQMELSRYDIVFINLSLHQTDVVEAMRKIRTHTLPSIRTTRVIGVATKEQFSERNRYKESGMQWLLFKPLDPAVVFAVVTAHLNEESDLCV